MRLSFMAVVGEVGRQADNDLEEVGLDYTPADLAIGAAPEQDAVSHHHLLDSLVRR